MKSLIFILNIDNTFNRMPQPHYYEILKLYNNNSSFIFVDAAMMNTSIKCDSYQ